MRFKIFISGFIALFYVLTAQGQNTDCFLYDKNVSIPLYGSYEDEVPAVLLYQDSLKENYYYVQLLENKGNKFRVHVTRVEDTVNIYGWIEKKYCKVWIWLMATDCIYLFSEPNSSSNYRNIQEDELIYNGNGYIATILEFSKKTEWLKLCIPTQSGNIYGWTLNYCGNIYGSCEGDRARSPSRVYGEINR